MYKLLYAESLLKQFIHSKGMKPTPAKVYIALEVSNRRILLADKKRRQVVSDEEWDILNLSNKKALNR